MINLHTVPGSELPDLVWHHKNADDPEHLVQRWAAPMFDGWRSKPIGGLFASVLRDYGTGPRSSWADYGTYAAHKSGAFISTLVPDPEARFVVIDSAADAVAAAQAFPGVEGEGTLRKVLGSDLDDFQKRVPDPSPAMASLLGYGDRQPPLIDWTLLAQHQYAGMWLTGRGEMECSHPAPGVPDFWGWDVEQVWFRAPELRVTSTGRWQEV